MSLVRYFSKANKEADKDGDRIENFKKFQAILDKLQEKEAEIYLFSIVNNI